MITVSFILPEMYGQFSTLASLASEASWCGTNSDWTETKVAWLLIYFFFGPILAGNWDICFKGKQP